MNGLVSHPIWSFEVWTESFSQATSASGNGGWMTVHNVESFMTAASSWSSLSLWWGVNFSLRKYLPCRGEGSFRELRSAKGE